MSKRAFISLTILILAMLVLIEYQDNKVTKLENKLNTSVYTIDSLNKVVDSLHDESFNAQAELGRYELSLDHLYEVNRKSATEFVNYMNHETE